MRHKTDCEARVRNKPSYAGNIIKIPSLWRSWVLRTASGSGTLLKMRMIEMIKTATYCRRHHASSDWLSSKQYQIRCLDTHLVNIGKPPAQSLTPTHIWHLDHPWGPMLTVVQVKKHSMTAEETQWHSWDILIVQKHSACNFWEGKHMVHAEQQPGSLYWLCLA